MFCGDVENTVEVLQPDITYEIPLEPAFLLQETYHTTFCSSLCAVGVNQTNHGSVLVPDY